VLGLEQAEHEESSPEAGELVISRLVCSLDGSTETVTLMPGTLTHRVYGQGEAAEKFACNYGLNPAYREQISQGALKVAGTGPAGEVRVVELSGHPFFVGTLFLPQLSSTADRPHPLIVAYLRAALDAVRRGGHGGRD